MARYQTGIGNGLICSFLALSLGCSSPPADDSRQTPPWPVEKIGPQLFSVKAQLPSGAADGFDRAKRIAVLEAKHYCASRNLEYQYFTEERIGVEGTPHITTVVFRCIAGTDQAAK
jgi:hypothetical protein